MTAKKAKRGRPKNPDGTNKVKPSILIDPDVYADLEAAREATRIPISSLVTHCCKMHLPKLLSCMTTDAADVGKSTPPKPIEEPSSGKVVPQIVGLDRPRKRGNGTENQ